MSSADKPPDDPHEPEGTLVDRLLREAMAGIDLSRPNTAGIEVDAANVHHSLSVLAGLIDGSYQIGFHSAQAERHYRKAADAVHKAAVAVVSALDEGLSPAASVAVLLRLAGKLARTHGLDRRLCARLAEHFLEPSVGQRLSTPMLTQLGEALARSDRSAR